MRPHVAASTCSASKVRRLVDTVDLRSRTSAYRFRVDDPVGAAALLERGDVCLAISHSGATRGTLLGAHLALFCDGERAEMDEGPCGGMSVTGPFGVTGSW